MLYQGTAVNQRFDRYQTFITFLKKSIAVSYSELDILCNWYFNLPLSHLTHLITSRTSPLSLSLTPHPFHYLSHLTHLITPRTSPISLSLAPHPSHYLSHLTHLIISRPSPISLSLAPHPFHYLSHLTHLITSRNSPIALSLAPHPSHYISHLTHLITSRTSPISLSLARHPCHYLSHLTHLITSHTSPISLSLATHPSHYLSHLTHLITSRTSRTHLIHINPTYNNTHSLADTARLTYFTGISPCVFISLCEGRKWYSTDSPQNDVSIVGFLKKLEEDRLRMKASLHGSWKNKTKE